MSTKHRTPQIILVTTLVTMMHHQSPLVFVASSQGVPRSHSMSSRNFSWEGVVILKVDDKKR